ncbi:hypothetical protein TNCV_4843721 [Trichonephila clavipes]|uniref:Uncharacterized protein n=1 Tax=Trichonephila clavipes TaxID=2585209 RepID=A0A8X7BLW0_TRICX|nr:hypothetical protein TNCV_4843721 [Trichonephila clavipes]
MFFKSSSLPIRMNCFLELLVLPIYHQSKTCGPCCTTAAPGSTTRCYTRSTLAICGSRMETSVPQRYIPSFFDFMPKRVAAVIANDGGYSNY